MKHIVNVTISNPAHDFVSMRTRQSTTNYMVEAKDEAEAILRASRHFRALGHYVHNAVIAESTLNEEVEQIDEESAHSIVNNLKADGKHQEAGAKAFEHGLGRKYGQHFGLRSTKNADEMDFHRGYDKAEMRSKKKVDEEVEQIDEISNRLMNSAENAARQKVRDAEDAHARGTGDRAAIYKADDQENRILDARTTRYNRQTRLAAKAPPKPAKPSLLQRIKNKLRSEEVEQIDELKKSTLASYITKASRQSGALYSLGKEFDDDKYKYAQKALKARTPKTKEQAKTNMETSGRLAKSFTRKAYNRVAGVSLAAAKLAKEEVESIDEVNAMHSPESMTAVLTPTAKIVRAAVGKTARDKAATKKYARRVAKISPDYSKKDVMDHLKSMGEEVEQIDEALDHEVNNYAKHMLNAHSADDLHVGNEHRDMAHQTLQDIKKNYGPVGVRWAEARAGEHIDIHNKAQRDAEKAIVMKRYKPTPPGAKVYQYPKSEVKEEVVNEKAPPGAKYERMVKHIKNQYSKDGTLTPQEKAIAYATAWKAKNAGK